MTMRRRVATGLLAATTAALAVSPSHAYLRPGKTEIASVSSDGTKNLRDVNAGPAISATGRFVAFVTSDPEMVVPDVNPGQDVFVRDRKLGKTELVSVSSNGVQGVAVTDCLGVSPAISATGRYVAFYSNASNLVPEDSNRLPDVFVHDRKTAKTEILSVSSSGRQQNDAYCEGPSPPQSPSISANGRYVGFVSPASNLVRGDTNGVGDVFVRDRKKGVTQRVSESSRGSQASGWSSCVSLSTTGRYVAFVSAAEDLVAGDDNGAPDTFVRDRKRQRTELVSVASDGSQAGSEGGLLANVFGGGGVGCDGGAFLELGISADGRHVVFTAPAPNLVPVDTPQPPGADVTFDVFTHDRRTGRTERVSVSSNGEEAEQGHSFAGGMSADGRFVTFMSEAKNFHPDDDEIPAARGDWDVFVHDRVSGATDMMSISPDGDDGACNEGEPLLPPVLPEEPLPVPGYADAPSISAGGRHVAFRSFDDNLVEEENPPGFVCAPERAFVRDLGPRLGVGTLRAPGGADEPLVISFGHRVAATAVRTVSDDSDDATHPVAAGAEILGATLAFRPQYEDLYIKIDVDRIPGPRGTGLAGNPAIVYGLKFTTADVPYEVRIARSGVLGGPGKPVFGLFRCDPACTEVAKLKGGYGTVGEAVVAAIPLEALGLQDGGEIEDLVFFAAVGAYEGGPSRLLDVVKPR